jgi:hypothetical protein
MLREDLAIQEEDLTEQGIHRTGRASLLRHSSYDADPLSFVIIGELFLSLAFSLLKSRLCYDS